MSPDDDEPLLPSSGIRIMESDGPLPLPPNDTPAPLLFFPEPHSVQDGQSAQDGSEYTESVKDSDSVKNSSGKKKKSKDNTNKFQNNT